MQDFNNKEDYIMSLAEQLKLEDETFTFELKFTTVTQTPEGTTVNATGKVGRYGKVWLTYNFSPNPNPENAHLGSFVGIGRAIADDGTQNEGQRRGVYVMDGLTATVYSLDDVTDGLPNFCIEHWDLAAETVTLNFSRIEKRYCLHEFLICNRIQRMYAAISKKRLL